MVDDETLDGQSFFFHIKGGQYGAVDRPQTGRTDDERGQMEPGDDIF